MFGLFRAPKSVQIRPTQIKKNNPVRLVENSENKLFSMSDGGSIPTPVAHTDETWLSSDQNAKEIFLFGARNYFNWMLTSQAVPIDNPDNFVCAKCLPNLENILRVINPEFNHYMIKFVVASFIILADLYTDHIISGSNLVKILCSICRSQNIFVTTEDVDMTVFNILHEIATDKLQLVL